MMHGCPDLVILRCCGNKRMLGYGDIGKVRLGCAGGSTHYLAPLKG